MPKRRLTSLKLSAIAAVDFPCQEGARALLMKRRTDPPALSECAKLVAKYVSEDDGAHSFDEVLQENQFSEAVWPLTDAFTQAIRSIMGDKTIAQADREAKIAESVDEFLVAVRSKAPPAEAAKIESELAELVKEGVSDMKTVEELTREVEKLTGQMTAATAQIGTLTTEKAAAVERAEKAEGELATEKAAHGETKKALVAASDETIKVGEREIKKSAVGEDMFALAKGQQEEAELARAEKRAEAEFPHVVGTAAEKATVLRAIDALPEPAQKAAQAILVSAEKMAAAGYERFGAGGGEEPESVAKAKADFEGKVSEIEKRDSCPRTTAMQKARTEHPDLFEAYQAALNDA